MPGRQSWPYKKRNRRRGWRLEKGQCWKLRQRRLPKWSYLNLNMQGVRRRKESRTQKWQALKLKLKSRVVQRRVPRRRTRPEQRWRNLLANNATTDHHFDTACSSIWNPLTTRSTTLHAHFATTGPIKGLTSTSTRKFIMKHSGLASCVITMPALTTCWWIISCRIWWPTLPPIKPGIELINVVFTLQSRQFPNLIFARLIFRTEMSKFQTSARERQFPFP